MAPLAILTALEAKASAVVTPPETAEVTLLLVANTVMSALREGLVGVPPIRTPEPGVVATLNTPVLLRFNVPPNATAPPPESPEPVLTVRDGFCSMGLVTPPEAMLS